MTAAGIPSGNEIIPRAFDIELNPAKKRHEYNYSKAGLYSDKGIVDVVAGEDYNYYETMFETTLSFKTYLGGVVSNSATTIKADVAALGGEFHPSAFYRLLGGAFIPSNRVTTGNDTIATATSTTITFGATAPVTGNLDAGVAFALPTVTTHDDRIRWFQRATAGGDNPTQGEVNRAYTTAESAQVYWPCTTLYTRDSLPSYFMDFEIAGDDGVYLCVGCYPTSCKIVMDANALPICEWTFAVAWWKRFAFSALTGNSLWVSTQSMYPIEPTSAYDEPVPFTYGSLYVGINGGTPEGVPVSNISFMVTNTLSPNKSPNAKYGISGWTLVDRKIECEMTPYFDYDWNTAFETQARNDVDLQLPIGAGALATQSYIAMRMPGMRLTEIPGREDIDGQLGQSVKGEASYVIAQAQYGGTDGTTSGSDRNHATLPVDSEFSIAFV